MRALPTPSSNPWLMPGLALAALVLVVAAWFVPLGSLGEREPPPARPLPVGPNDGADLKGLPPYEIPDWSALEPRLMALRDPVEKPVEAVTESPGPGGEGGSGDPPPPPPPDRPKIAWSYIGYIDDGDGLQALVRDVALRQRLLRTGQVINDETDPRAQDLTVVSITPEEVRLSQRGEEFSLRMEAGAPPAAGIDTNDPRLAPGSRGAPQRPGILPPGQRPGRSSEF